MYGRKQVSRRAVFASGQCSTAPSKTRVSCRLLQKENANHRFKSTRLACHCATVYRRCYGSCSLWPIGDASTRRSSSMSVPGSAVQPKTFPHRTTVLGRATFRWVASVQRTQACLSHKSVNVPAAHAQACQGQRPSFKL